MREYDVGILSSYPTGSGPVLNIDIAKGKSVAAALLSYQDCMYKPFPFYHSEEDLKRLLVILEEMKSISGLEPKVVLEEPLGIIQNLLPLSFLPMVFSHSSEPVVNSPT
ncbi:hypothetical protein [Paenibacillus lemnae]|uniref:hypothetical protein n=1 Tax=Paenibacillus lemnae TaxID=1330551 RepID=UPI001FE35D1C|nr:hypothetical protein [Paenibacillus lemnae]